MLSIKKSIGFLALFLVACTGLGGEEQEKISQRLEVLGHTLDFFEAREELPYLQAMADSDTIYDTIGLWRGVDKKMKQKMWFVKEDVESVIESCEDENKKCYFADELKQLKRAVDTAVKAYETDDVNESNQLNSLSAEIGYEILASLLKIEEGEVLMKEEDLYATIDRFFAVMVRDLVELKMVCDEIDTSFHSWARYEGYCGPSLIQTIQALSNQINDAYVTDDSPNMFQVILACSIEAKVIGTYGQDLEVSEECPYVSEKVNNIRWQHDLYLAE